MCATISTCYLYSGTTWVMAPYIRLVPSGEAKQGSKKICPLTILELGIMHR
jgi:hypothetical protein